MRIALTIAPVFTDKSIPLGLACINGGLRQAGHAVAVFDFDFLLNVENPALYYVIRDYAVEGDRHVVNFLGCSDLAIAIATLLNGAEEELPGDVEKIQAFASFCAKQLLDAHPEEIWFSTYISNVWVSMLIAIALRNLDYGGRIGFGGPGIYGHQLQRFLLTHQIVDHCFVGEGEVTAIKYAELGHPTSGMAWIGLENTIEYEARPLAKSLDDLPLPDYTGFPMPGLDVRAYLRRQSFEGIPIYFSRGCVHKCSFCAEQNIWQRFRTRTIPHIIDELRAMRDCYGVSLFYACDSLVNFTDKWLEEFCDAIISVDLGVTFSFAFAQGTRLPASLATKMVQAGFTRIFIGAEHGSQRMLDKMKKGTTVDEIGQIIHDTTLAGLSVRVGTIVNYPGETIDDVLEEIAFFKHIDDALRANGLADIDLPGRSLSNSFRLDPDTEMIDHPEQFGIRLYMPQLPNTISDATRGVCVRWEYVEPHDNAFHSYLVSRFGNQPDRWHLRSAQSMRTANSLQNFLRDDDLPVLAENAECVDTEGGKFIVTPTREIPLDHVTGDIMECFQKGQSLRETKAALGDRHQISAPMLRKLVSLLYIEGAVSFDVVAPFAPPCETSKPPSSRLARIN